MPDDAVLQSVNDDPNVSLNPSGVSSAKGLGGGREWAPDIVSKPDQPLVERQDDKISGMTEIGSEKLPSVQISQAIESEEKVVEKVQKSDAQIPKRANDAPPNIINEVSGKEQTHHLKTADTLTTIADADEEEFIKEVEHHAHVH